MMRRAMGIGLLRVALLALLAGCGAQPPDADRAPPQAPVATARLRAGEIRIADRPEIEITVTAAPGWRVQPPSPTGPVAGFEIVEWRTLPLVRDARNEIHRQRIRLRATEVGDFVWPALSLEVAGPDGASVALALPPIPLRVGSVMDEHPGRSEPFGARPAPRPAASARPTTRSIAAAGAALALALAALLFGARRRARRSETPAPSPVAPWHAALRALDRAQEASDDPVEAGHRGAAALRSYVDRRFGTRTRQHTTEEIAAAAPPFAATTSWPTLVALLRDLDALRFRSAAVSDAPGRAALEAALARARAFVDATMPPEGLR